MFYQTETLISTMMGRCSHICWLLVGIHHHHSEGGGHGGQEIDAGKDGVQHVGQVLLSIPFVEVTTKINHRDYTCIEYIYSP